MSAPTPAPGDDRPRDGYYPDPSIPGYVRYWNGAAWVPGTSRPAPAAGETLPRPPGVSPQPMEPAPPSVTEETGPVFFDEEPRQPSAAPQQGPGTAEHPGIPEQPGPDQPERPDETVAEPYAATIPGQTGAAGRRPQPEPSGRQETRPDEAGHREAEPRDEPSWAEEPGRQGGRDAPEERPGHELEAAASGPAGSGAGEGAERGFAPDTADGPGGGFEQGAPERQPDHVLRTDAGRAAGGARDQQDGPQPERGRHGMPERAPAWGADPSRQSGFGSEQDRRVSWGSQGADPGAPRAPWPGAEPADGTMPLHGAEEGTVSRGSQGTSGAVPSEEQGSGAPGGPGRADAPGEGTMMFRRPDNGDRPRTPPKRPVDPGEGGTVAIRAVRPGGGRSPGGSGGPGAQVPPQAGQFGGPQGPQTTSPVPPNPQTMPYLPHQPGGPAGGPGSQAAPPWRPDAPQPGSGAHGAGPGGDEPVVPWRPPVSDPFTAAAQAQAASRPAPLGKRLVARLIDTAITGAVTAAAAVPLGSKAVDHIHDKIDAAKLSGETVTVWLLDGTTATSLGIVLAVLILFGAFYEALPTAKWGRTLGKSLCGLTVRDIEAHQPPGFGAALRRWLVYSVPGLLVIGLLGVLWCLFDRPWRQCWHDKAARTFVAS